MTTSARAATDRQWRGAMVGLCAAVAAAVVAMPASAAEDMPTFSIEFKDGTIAPVRLEVPANRPFKIELHNTGDTPAEFESTELHLEKVLAPQSSSSLVIRRLSGGEHKFFDDFHPEAPQAVLIAK
jgi:hypothetical protein